MAGVLAIATEPVKAFYDDTHYSLTYHIARSCGFTPLQAYRLASAAVSVDYAPLTKPEQYGAWLPASTQYLTENAHNARVSFHAFWDSRSSGTIERRTAKGRYLEQERRLFVLATSERNAGVLLHHVQDEEPHAGYGSTGGSGRADLMGKTPNLTESQRLEDEFQQAADSCDKKEEEQKRTDDPTQSNTQPPPTGRGGVGTAIKAGLVIAGAAVGGLYLKSELDKLDELFPTTTTTTTTPPTTTPPASAGTMTYLGGTFTCTFNAGGVLNLCNNSNIRVNITTRMAVGTILRLTASGMVSSSLPQTRTDPPGEVIFQNFNGPGNFDTCPAPIRQLILFNNSRPNEPIATASVSIPVSCR